MERQAENHNERKSMAVIVMNMHVPMLNTFSKKFKQQLQNKPGKDKQADAAAARLICFRNKMQHAHGKQVCSAKRQQQLEPKRIDTFHPHCKQTAQQHASK